jgi:hypothetical protein
MIGGFRHFMQRNALRTSRALAQPARCARAIGTAACVVVLTHCGSSVNTQALPPALTSSASSSTNVGTNAPITLQLPPTTIVNSGMLNFAAPTNAGATTTTFTLTVQPAPPSTSPALSLSASRLPEALPAGAPTALATLIVTSSTALTFPNSPTLTVVLPAADIVASGVYELAYDDPSSQQWNLAWAGPATVSGTTLTFAPNGAPFSLSAGVPAVFELLRYSNASPTPSPSPTPTPSPSPSSSPSPAPGAITVSLSTVALVIGGTPTSQTLTVSQANALPTFTPALTCALGAGSAPGTVATIVPVGSTSPSSPGGAVSFTVDIGSPSPSAGTCTGTIASSAGGSPATFSVTVTETEASIQSRSRR